MEALLENILYFGIAVTVVYLAAKYFKNKQTQASIVPQMAKRQPIEKRDFTREELKEFDGRDETKPILLGCKGKVYDVSKGEGFYGPGGSYSAFAGRDASRALAMSSTDLEVASNPRTDDLSKDELETLDEWAARFEFKYPLIGNIVDSKL